jgi:hypothetical protein
MENDAQFRNEHRQWIEKSIRKGGGTREPEWTENIAVGSEQFVDEIRGKLQPRLLGRKVRKSGDHFELREQEAVYRSHLGGENKHLRLENTFYLDVNI